MHIKLINKKIYFDKYKVKCALGKRGISSNKREGDNKTPRGTYKFKAIFYRKDRVKKINNNFIKTYIIKKNMGWCDDIKSKNYNKLVKLPFLFSAEKLYKKNNTYDIFVLLDFNFNPIIKNKGSAIFLHVAKKKFLPTEGCIAINKTNMRYIISKIKKNSKITIY